MAVAYHTHLFEIPTATDAETQAGVITDKLVVPAGLAAALASYVTSSALTTTLADYALSASLGTAAAEDVGYFATAAQGALADSALQPAAIGSTVQAYDADLAAIAALAKTDGNIIVGDGTNWTVESGATARASLGLGNSAVADFATQAEAEAGSGTTQAMSPLRAKQLVDYERTQARSFTAAQTFTTASSGTTGIKLESTAADAIGGPQLDFVRTSASPAANDVGGVIRFRGMNSAAAEFSYGNINSTILDTTAGSEDGRLILQVPVAGAQTSAVSIANGMIVGAPTGSYQGTGTVNATDYYRNGTALSSTLFGVAVGDASGNLKALNADGGFTFATTATSTNTDGVNAGVWKTAHRIDSTDTATYSGSRTTMAILRGYTGSGENGPTRSDTALHLEAEQDNWLTTSVLGESDTLRIFNRKGVNGDMAGMLINVSKVESASYGSLAWEAASNWVQATTGTTLRLMRTNSGHQGPSTDLRGGGVGFNATAMTGNHNIAFAAFEDYTDTGQWKYPFLGADGYLNGDEYFYVTGPAHASGKGKLYTSGIAHIAATVAAPAGGGATGMIAIGNLATFGIYFGTGAPTVSAAKGSLYLRRDGTTTNNRAYINTDGGTTWTAITTVA